MEKMLGVPCVTVTSYAFAHFEDTLKPETDLDGSCWTQEGESTNTIDAFRKQIPLEWITLL